MDANAELLALATLAAEVREVQREFFDRDRRRPDTVGRAKALERELDRRLAEILEPAENPTLF